MRDGMLRILGGLALVGALIATPALAEPRPDDLKQHHAKERVDKIQELYTDLVFPTPTLIISGQKSVAHIFDDHVAGRVTPVGEFDHPEAVNEYFFGLASTPTSKVVAVDFKSLAASGDKVAVEVDITFDRPANPTKRFLTLRQTGFFTFNDDDRVISFDLAILNLGAAVNPTSDAEKETNIQTVCALLTVGFPPVQPATCPGFYDSVAPPLTGFAACVAFMHTIPYGTWDRANSNTFVCRQLHSLLTPYRPAVHCPHCSQGGGGVCIDFTYDSFFDQEF